ncbi:MAG TPA: DUF4249 family protein [Flavisolibacter sp.]
MKRVLIYFAVVMVLSFAGCTRTADVNIPPHTSLLVLHGYVPVGEHFRVALGKSLSVRVPVTDTGNLVTNGWVLLYEENVFIDSLEYDPVDRMYVSNNSLAVAGRRYKIIAGAPGFVPVEAETIATGHVPTTSVVNIKNARSTTDGTLLNDIRFRFQDPLAFDNFYITELHTVFGGYECVYTYDPAVERYTGASAPFDQTSCIGNEEIIYNDRSFNGQQKEITISASAQSVEPFFDAASGIEFKAYLIRRNVSEDHYRYFKNQVVLAAEGPTFSNPANIRTNVKNGYGLFSVYSVAVDTLP